MTIVHLGRRIGRVCFLARLAIAENSSTVASSITPACDSELVPITRSPGTCMSERSFSDRETLLSTISSSNLRANSLVQLENPLLIWGAIAGSVAMAGIAAAVIALGAVALTVGLLWYFGVFNSHKDRRRKQDTNPPCESIDPLDTNDSDCFHQRWNKMNWYFNIHAGLRRGQRLIVQGEAEIDDLAADVWNRAQHNQDRLFGHGGTSGKPSKTSGVLHDIDVTKNGLDQLDTVNRISIDGFTEAVDIVQSRSQSDVLELRSRLLNAAVSLRDDANAASSIQQESVRLNSNRMTVKSTEALTRVVDDVIIGQKSISDALRAVSHDLQHSKVNNRFARNELSRKLDDADSMELVGSNAFLISTDRFRSQTETDLLNSLAELGEKSQDSVRFASGQLAGMMNELGLETLDQVRESRSEWQNLTQASVRKSISLADALDGNLEGNSSLIFEKNKRLIDAIDFTKNAVEERQKHSNNTRNAISRGAILLSQDTQSEVSKSVAETNVLESDIDRGSVDVKEHAVELLSTDISSKAPGQAVPSLLSALGDTETVQRRKIMKNSISLEGDISRVLSSLSGGSELLSKGFTDLVSGIRPGGGIPMTLNASLASDLLKRLLSVDWNTSTELSGMSFRDSGLMDVIRNMRGGDLASLQNVSTSLRNSSASSVDRVDNVRQYLSHLLKSMNQPMPSILLDDHKSSLSILASLVSSGDEEVGAALKSVMQSESFKLGFSDPTGDLYRILSNTLKRIPERSPSVVDVNQERTLDTMAAMAQTVLRMDNESRSIDFEAMRSSINTEMRKKLMKSALVTNQTIDVLRSSILDNQLNELYQFVSSVIQSRKSTGLKTLKVPPVVDQVNIDELRTLVEKIQNIGYLDSVDALNTLESDLARAELSTSTDVKKIQKSFTELKLDTDERQQNLAREILRQITILPSVVASEDAEIDSNFELSMSDLAVRIREAKERIAIARSDDEKMSVTRGLIVLLKLAAIQQGVRDASLLVRNQVSSLQNSGTDLRNDIQGAEATTLAAIETVTASLDKKNTRIDSMSELTEWIAELIRNHIQSSASGMMSEATKTALDQAFTFAKTQTRSRKMTNETSNTVRDLLNVTEAHETSTTILSAESDEHLHRLKRLDSVSISAAVDEALQHVVKDAGNLRSTSLDSQKDVLTRLAEVRLAVSSFLALLVDLGRTERQTVAKISLSDSELRNQVNRVIENELFMHELITNKTSSRIQELYAKLLGVNESETESIRRFASDINSVIGTIHEGHNETVNKFVKIDSMLENTLDLESSESDSVLNKIDQMISNFTDDVF